VRRGGEDDDVGTESISKFHGHMTEPAETDHANFLALGDAPMMHGRVSRDAGTQQRRGSGGIKIGRDTQDEAFIDDDAFGVATVGKTSKMFVRRVEGEDHVRAELFKPSLAVRAGAVGIDHAADRDEIAWLVPCNCRANLGDTADNLMAGNDWVIRGHELAPLVPYRMKIGVADAAEEDLNLHIAISWITTLDFG
jgi:hypothetical protein